MTWNAEIQHDWIVFNQESIMRYMNSGQACAVLEVSPDATFEEIRAAYRRLALELHPDKKKTDNDGRKFQEINEAYSILKSGHRPTDAPVQDTGKAYTEGKTSKKRGFSESRSRWGPPPGSQKPPEQDWSKYTSEFEDENPDFWKEYERKFWEDYDKTVNADGRNGEYEKTQEPKEQPNLSVQVDPSLCIACQSCETIAPGVFHIDSSTNMNPKSKVINMRGAGLNKIMNAAETCPTRAISVDDKDARKRLYPH